MNFVPLTNVVPGVVSRLRQIPGAPVNGTDAVRTLTVTASGGACKLSFGGFRTASLAYNANAAAQQTAIRALPNVGASGCTVTGTGPFVYTFGGKLGRKLLGAITVVESTLTGGTWTFAATTPGVDATMRGCATGTVVTRADTGAMYINAGTPNAPSWSLQA